MVRPVDAQEPGQHSRMPGLDAGDDGVDGAAVAGDGDAGAAVLACDDGAVDQKRAHVVGAEPDGGHGSSRACRRLAAEVGDQDGLRGIDGAGSVGRSDLAARVPHHLVGPDAECLAPEIHKANLHGGAQRLRNRGLVDAVRRVQQLACEHLGSEQCCRLRGEHSPRSVQSGGSASAWRTLSILSIARANAGKLPSRDVHMPGHWAPCPEKTMATRAGAAGAAGADAPATAASSKSSLSVMTNARWRMCSRRQASVCAVLRREALPLARWALQLRTISSSDSACFAEKTRRAGGDGAASVLAAGAHAAGAASTMAWALAPPRPNELTLTRAARPTGHGVGCKGTLRPASLNGTMQCQAGFAAGRRQRTLGVRRPEVDVGGDGSVFHRKHGFDEAGDAARAFGMADIRLDLRT